MTSHAVALTDPRFVAFWRERHLCSVSTVRPDGGLHVTPMGIVLDPDAGQAWGITSRISVKAANVAAGSRVAACQIDGRAWSSIEGPAEILANPDMVAEAERRYAERYRVPRVNPDRVALRISIEHALANLPE